MTHFTPFTFANDPTRPEFCSRNDERHPQPCFGKESRISMLCRRPGSGPVYRLLFFVVLVSCGSPAILRFSQKSKSLIV